jgi:hypothetical protein
MFTLSPLYPLGDPAGLAPGSSRFGQRNLMSAVPRSLSTALSALSARCLTIPWPFAVPCETFSSRVIPKPSQAEEPGGVSDGFRRGPDDVGINGLELAVADASQSGGGEAPLLALDLAGGEDQQK